MRQLAAQAGRADVIVRDVQPASLLDLLATPHRITLAAVIDGRLELLAIGLTADDPAHPQSSSLTVTVPPEAPDLTGRDVVVLTDDGPQWFHLRSLTFRGTAVRHGADPDRYRIAPTRVVAWDYGSLREDPATCKAGRETPGRDLSTSVDSVLPTPYESRTLTSALSASRVMIVGTQSEKGRPFAVPLWFVRYRGHLVATTSASSWTARNIATSPHAVILLGGENADDAKRLIVRAHARAVPGAPPLPVLARVAWRYYLAPRFARTELRHLGLWARRVRYYRQSPPAHLILTPLSARECSTPASNLPPRPAE